MNESINESEIKQRQIYSETQFPQFQHWIQPIENQTYLVTLQTLFMNANIFTIHVR